MTLSTDQPTGPLSDLIVADFSRVLAGPYASMTLADLGATVIKVERPGVGDDTRAWGPPWAGDSSTYFQGLNRNKHSISLDLADADDLDTAQRLVARADVLVENFKPGTLDRWSLGYEQLKQSNPGLIYCSITGFGDSAAAKDLPGYDLIIQACSGLMSVTGEEDGPPLKVGVALVDHICALQAVVGILAALRYRSSSGLGQRVAVSLMGAALAAMLNQAAGYLGAGFIPAKMGNKHPSIAPYQTFPTADGHLVLACGNDMQFVQTAKVAGRPDLSADIRFISNSARVENRDELESILIKAFAQRSAVELAEEFTTAGVPAGTIFNIAEALGFAHQIGLDVISEVDVGTGESFSSVASPIQLSRTPCATRLAPPSLGQDNSKIREWLDC